MEIDQDPVLEAILSEIAAEQEAREGALTRIDSVCALMYLGAFRRSRMPMAWIRGHEGCEETLALRLWDLARGMMREVPGTCEEVSTDPSATK